MKLTDVEYSEYGSTKRAWYLDKLELQEINLIVGKNATGKSRTISIIANLSNLLAGQINQPFENCRFKATFSDEGKEYVYEIEFKDKTVFKEELKENGNKLMERDLKGDGNIYYEKERQHFKFSIPPTTVAAVAKLDRVQHSFLIKLNSWAQNTHFYRFGDKMGRDNSVLTNVPFPKSVNSRDSSQVVNLFKIGVDLFGNRYKKKILSDMGSIGYELTQIGIKVNPDRKGLTPNLTTVDVSEIYVDEKGIDWPIYQAFMSQGMFRCLSIIIQINYCVLNKVASTILIDDIGEGLDYERSVALLKVLTQVVVTSSVQIAMTTNDRFIMNGVDLKYWTVLYRENSHCKNYTSKNSDSSFSDFKYTGLSNFDFFKNEFFRKK